MGNIVLATRTLEAFEQAVEFDQGARFRFFLREAMGDLEDAYRPVDEGYRSHLGASQIGNECSRASWYNFHWVHKPHFSGRIIRLFNRGHLEEGRFIALLKTINCQVYTADQYGKQFRISEYGGHFGGSTDSVAIGIPDLDPQTPALAEFKTHGDKSFAKLVKEGVRIAKFEHWIQMQLYMYKLGLAVALYLAVNKNDDHIHAELVYLDSPWANKYIVLAGALINGATPPPRIGSSTGWGPCTFCDYKPVCRLGKVPEKNCRTCAHAEPVTDPNDPFYGKWQCNNSERRMTLLFPATNPKNEDFSLTKERQLIGCEYYELSGALQS